MRALTLRHPWAFAIAHLGKTVENRHWDDDYARWVDLDECVGKQLAIHGGLAPKRGQNRAWRDFQANADACARIVQSDLDTRRLWRAHFGHKDNLLPEDLILPGVVAIATLSAVTFSSHSVWAAPGQRQLVLTNVITLPEPVKARGGRGIWALEPETLAEVKRQLLLPITYQEAAS